jgi:hypothetical protein
MTVSRRCSHGTETRPKAEPARQRTLTVYTDVRRVLDALADGTGEPGTELPAIEQFEFEFDARFRPLLAMIGVTPGTAHVTLTRDRFTARFGPWTCETSISNVREVCRTGPYQWYKAIGPRGSFVDRGATFGTTTNGGVCVRFDEPVPGLVPVGALRHPGLTLTLAEPERFACSLRRRAGLA